MAWIIGLLTVILVLDCLFLILLVLIQLPKKEAGLGQAFGSATTDALFGAGSGTALTKMTKYAAGVFFALTFLLTILSAQYAKTRGRSFEKQMQDAAKTAEPAAPVATAKPAPPADTNIPAAASTTLLLSTATNVASAATNLLSPTATNVTAPPSTNPPTKPPIEAPK